jgi:hypothetical protein
MFSKTALLREWILGGHGKKQAKGYNVWQQPWGVEMSFFKNLQT